jgi:hypothetical protein
MGRGLLVSEKASPGVYFAGVVEAAGAVAVVAGFFAETCFFTCFLAGVAAIALSFAAGAGVVEAGACAANAASVMVRPITAEVMSFI